MPKLLPMTIEVEEIAFGHVWSTLNKMQGVAKLHLGDNRKMAKANGHSRPKFVRGKFDKTGTEFIVDLLTKVEAMSNKEFVEAFEAAGRPGVSANSAIHTSIKNGDVIRNEKLGKYVLSKKAKDRIRHRKAKK